MRACTSRCRFRASGVEGAGMARSSVAAAISFWLARGGVSGLSTLKSALMRSRACRPNSRARSPRAEASPAMEAWSSRTVRYSSASLALSSRAWASCTSMSAPAGVLGPAARRGAIPGAGVTSPSPAGHPTGNTQQKALIRYNFWDAAKSHTSTQSGKRGQSLNVGPSLGFSFNTKYSLSVRNVVPTLTSNKR
jgi:hypothetical protein